MNRFTTRALGGHSPPAGPVSSRRRLVVLAALVLSLLPGCGGGTPAVPDATEARATLERALTSWREGGTIGDLANASPPIVVSDSKWERGLTLSQFEVEDPPIPSGAQQKFRVTLRLADAKGKERQEGAQYEVGTHPVHTVFRVMLQ